MAAAREAAETAKRRHRQNRQVMFSPAATHAHGMQRMHEVSFSVLISFLSNLTMTMGRLQMFVELSSLSNSQAWL